MISIQFRILFNMLTILSMMTKSVISPLACGTLNFFGTFIARLVLICFIGSQYYTENHTIFNTRKNWISTVCIFVKKLHIFLIFVLEVQKKYVPRVGNEQEVSVRLYRSLKNVKQQWSNNNVWYSYSYK